MSDIKAFVHPDDILLTVDAMTGQDIVNVAGSFHEQLEVTGLVLTKLDGDSRGGGILSVRSITQVPVKFVGLGEKIDDLDVFHPDRMADRILGMGDIMSLVEQAQDKMDIEASTKSANRMMSGQFTLTDMLVQFQQLEKNGVSGRYDEADSGDEPAGRADRRSQSRQQNEEKHRNHSEYDDGGAGESQYPSCIQKESYCQR